MKKKHKIKETAVGNFLKDHGFIFETMEQPPLGGCSKYRPDMVLDFGILICIIEVDEFQHKRGLILLNVKK